MSRTRFGEWIKKSYIALIVAMFYIPLFFGALFSFSRGQKKGSMSMNFVFSGEGWTMLFSDSELSNAIMSTITVAIPVVLIVAAMSLLVSFGIWRQKSRLVKGFVNATANIPLINPDIITAISISIAFTAMIGTMGFYDTGYWRAVMAQVTMIMPFGITIMVPKSEKFSATLLEASKDLGYGPVRTWFKTYFIHMIPVIASTMVVAMVLSFDDFIITRTVSKVDTIGSKMYEGAGTVQPWKLALGTAMLFVTLLATFATATVVHKKEKQKKGK